MIHHAAGAPPSLSVLPAPSPLASNWSLDPGVVFLNHGSFGATPRVVLAAQSRRRDELEREPVGTLVERHWDEMDRVREALGRFVACPPEGLALVPNATIGVATALAHVALRPGDELLVGRHEYPACQNAFRAAATRAGATVVQAQTPFPCPGPGAVIDAYLARVSPRTRLALVSHVTSPTGLIYPAGELSAALRARGVRVLIDGAHAPGMVEGLAVGAMAPDYYTANCHKWVCSPKAGGFLYVAPEHRATLRPLVLSNNAESPRPGRDQFRTEFDYVGTQDYTPYYTIPDAIRAMEAMVSGGWAEVRRRNRDLCLRARTMLCREWGAQPPAPPEMIGSIASIILPPHEPALAARLAGRPTKYADALQDNLLARWKIQVPVWPMTDPARRVLRISAQLYNSMEQYEYLARAVIEELERERRG